MEMRLQDDRAVCLDIVAIQENEEYRVIAAGTDIGIAEWLPFAVDMDHKDLVATVCEHTMADECTTDYLMTRKTEDTQGMPFAITISFQSEFIIVNVMNPLEVVAHHMWAYTHMQPGVDLRIIHGIIEWTLNNRWRI